VYIKSSIDGRTYRVKNNKLKNQAADLLATVNLRILRLIKSLNEKKLRNFNPDNVHENILNFDTTFTVDKGRMTIYCLGPRDSLTVELYDINTMMYVAIHELAHVATESIGHTEEFKINFKRLLKKAIELNLYKFVDYSKNPINYCGINLKSSILS
jgi:hypothetical protein